jgi:hypothetical protein
MKNIFIRLLTQSALVIKQAVWILGAMALYSGSLLTVQAQTNPYAAYLNELEASLPGLPSLPTQVTSAWTYYPIGLDMQYRTWAITSPLSTLTSAEKSSLTTQVQTEMAYLLNSSNDINGQWFANGRSGDVNADRFTLSTIMQVLYQLKKYSVLTSNLGAWDATAQVAVDFQYNNYGQKNNHDWATMLAGYYPNQDITYAEIVGDAGLIYGNSVVLGGVTYNYTSSAQAFVVDVKNLVQSGGTITTGTIPSNPVGGAIGASINYTDIDIDYLALYLQDTGDPNARSLMVAMKNYLPKQMVNAGISEVSTAPWWKTSITPFTGSPGASDTIAGITGDPLNSYFAQQLLSYSGVSGPTEGDGDGLLAGAAFWQAVTAVTPNSNILFPDPDISGSRGHFGAFNWVGILNHEQTTCVGATLAGTNFVQNPGFEFEVGGAATDYTFSTYAGTPTYSVSTTVAHSGSNSMEISGTTADRGSVVVPDVPIIPGHSYTFSIWYQNSSTLAASAILVRGHIRNVVGVAIPWSLSWITSSAAVSNSVASGELYMTATSSSVGVWTQITMTFTAPAAAVAFSPELFNAYGNGSIWWDDISTVDNSNGAPLAALNSVLEEVSPEVGILGTSNSLPLYQQAAYSTGLTYPGADLVSANGDFSILSSQFVPQEPTHTTDGNYGAAPAVSWQVNQSWLLLPDRMVGDVNMTSLTNHQDKYVRMRVRTAPGGMLKEIDSTHFTSAALDVNLVQNNFTGLAAAPAIDADGNGTPDADEIFLTEAGAASPATYVTGQSHNVLMSVASSTTDAANGDPLTASSNLTGYGNLTGFSASNAQNNYYVWFNTGNSEAQLNFTVPTSTWPVLNNLFVGGKGLSTVAPTTITGSTVSTSVPAYGSVCVQQTRNLLPNPGFEQVTSGVPTDYTSDVVLGSPVLTVDSSPSDLPHGGANSIEITGGGDDAGGVQSPEIPIVQGKNYQVTVWYKSTVNGNDICSRMTLRNSTNGVVTWNPAWVLGTTGSTEYINGAQLYVKAVNSNPGTWSSFTFKFVATSPATTLSVEFLNWFATGTVWFDDVSLEQTP